MLTQSKYNEQVARKLKALKKQKLKAKRNHTEFRIHPRSSYPQEVIDSGEILRMPHIKF